MSIEKPITLVQFWRSDVWDNRLNQAGEAFLKRSNGNALFYFAVVSFAALWTIYDTVSRASIDIHFDVGEVSGWSETFAFGYKHPPVTAWIFHLWFSIFPRADWAAYLLAVTSTAITFVVIWRLLRDYLDKERALFGIAALFLVPLYTFQASRFNANTVMMPFWAATVLFYLRAHRNLTISDAALAGAFAALTFLGKYWGIYLIAGMAFASLIGPGTRRFWRSPAPYVMAVTAAIVVAPHIDWLLTGGSQVSLGYLTGSVMTADPFGASLLRSLLYFGGALSYVVIPILFLIALRPSKAAIADILWPSDPDRQQVVLLFAIPLFLPALANLIFPHRLTALWTFPNWALLPIVLFGSPLMAVPAKIVARSGIVALAISLTAVIASPCVAYARLPSQHWHYRQLATEIQRRAGGESIGFIAGGEIAQGILFYLPKAQQLSETTSATDIKNEGLAAVCVIGDDSECRRWTNAVSPAANVTFRHRFLGFEGMPVSYSVTVIRPDRAVAQ